MATALEIYALPMLGTIVWTRADGTVFPLPPASAHTFACLARPMIVALVQAAAHGAVGASPAGMTVTCRIVAKAVV